MVKLTSKIWGIFLVSLGITVLSLFLFSNILYETLYVEEVQHTLEAQAERLVVTSDGKLTQEFVEKVEAYNDISPSEIFAVQNPRELSACLPFAIDYDALITGDDRQKLLTGEVLVKRGYQSRFDREVISVIYPIVEDNRLNGIIYSYTPLAPVQVFIEKYVIYFAVGSFLLFLLLAIISRILIVSLFRPLVELQNMSREFEKGNYAARTTFIRNDELGTLSKAFNEMADAVEREDHRKKEFIGVVSHELRTPLSSILGYSQGLSRKQISVDDYNEVFQLLSHEAERMKRLTDDLLVVARNEEIYMNIQPLVGSEIILQALKIVQPRLLEKKISIEKDIQDDVIIFADEEKMIQILINVLDNAISYSEEKSVIFVQLNSKESFAQFTVIDYGVGIEEQHIPYLTQKFYRVNKARSRQDGGSGLGLTIVQDLVTHQHGELEISSEFGKGTKVTINIPIWKEEEV